VPNDSLLLLTLNRVSFLKPAERLLLAELYGTVAELRRLSRPGLEHVLGRTVRVQDWSWETYLKEAEQDRKYLTNQRINSIFYWDAAYPPQLREIYDPPLVLFTRGRRPDNGAPLAAVVGTRHPSGAAREAAYKMGFGLAELGIGTVSGLALGIDAEAHRGALDAGGVTLAVLGNGVDTIFPRTNADLGRRILRQGGLLVSEYPPGTAPKPYHFPARNRIISGLCRSVLVVQAPERSGALITADFALEQGRDLAVHAAGLSGIVGRGSSALSEAGATVVQTAEDLLSTWGERPPGRSERTVAQAPDSEAPDPEAAASAGAAGAILARCLELELAGQGNRYNGNYIIRQQRG
jgi:DNA processing protein